MFKTEWTPIVPAVTELAGEAGTLAVWLIGSRANGTERKDSDWDLLVFCEQEPVPAPQKREFVDILRVGPSGRVLLEGKSEEHMLQLANFQWKVIAKRHASYVGTKFIESSCGVAVDYDSPRVLSSNLKAILLWSIEDGLFST
jgi:hypothetical protein